MTIRLDAERRITSINASCEKQMGCSKAELIGKDISVIIAKEKDNETIIYGIRTFKIDNPLIEIKEKFNKNLKDDPLLDEYVLDVLITLLKYLDRKDESIQVEEIKDKLYRKKQ